MVSLACVSRPSEAVEPRAASDPTHPTPVESDATVWVAVTLRAFEEGSGREYRTVQVDQLGEVGITRDQRGDVGHSGKGTRNSSFGSAVWPQRPRGVIAAATNTLVSATARGATYGVAAERRAVRTAWTSSTASAMAASSSRFARSATRVMSARKSALAALSSPAPRYLSNVQRPCRPAQRSPRARRVRALRYVPGAEVMSWSRGAPTNPPP